ncbi:MAG: endonuclease III [Oscillospiraceae bacterium]|nr:endonuclease III [Oscillospiraceae bacterium]MBR2805597.1 endonuclease III [Oscillospiraceae bacterium]
MTKKQKVLKIIEILENRYPELGKCLTQDEAWQLVVSVRLAAQCTDARVDIVTKDLFAKYPSPRALADAPVSDIEEMVRPCGLGRTKARDISLAMKIIADNDNVVPDTMEELLKIPGVGRKSANLILGDIYGKPAIVTDTHCIRICNRLGLVDTDVPQKVEMELWKIVPPEKGNDLCHRFVLYGRDICTARSPKCKECPLMDLCKAKVNL